VVDLPGMSIERDQADLQVSVARRPNMLYLVSAVLHTVQNLADVIDMIKDYISKKENVIVHCMAAGSCEFNLRDTRMTIS
jgi:Tat protein secretion system quality control protein TatD with DNase activity